VLLEHLSEATITETVVKVAPVRHVQQSALVYLYRPVREVTSALRGALPCTEQSCNQASVRAQIQHAALTKHSSRHRYLQMRILCYDASNVELKHSVVLCIRSWCANAQLLASKAAQKGHIVHSVHMNNASNTPHREFQA
jgi:hypothetical protein